MLKTILGDPNARKLKKYQPYVADVNVLEEEIQALSDDQLTGKTAEFKQRLEKASTDRERAELLDDLLPEAFAVVREAGRRVLGCATLMFSSWVVLSCTKDKSPR
jgi:preprotein translocase subunit SecA